MRTSLRVHEQTSSLPAAAHDTPLERGGQVTKVLSALSIAETIEFLPAEE
jgi:hypothetical protein